MSGRRTEGLQTIRVCAFCEHFVAQVCSLAGLKRPTSNAQHPTSKRWMLGVGCWMLDVDLFISQSPPLPVPKSPRHPLLLFGIQHPASPLPRDFSPSRRIYEPEAIIPIAKRSGARLIIEFFFVITFRCQVYSISGIGPPLPDKMRTIPYWMLDVQC